MLTTFISIAKQYVNKKTHDYDQKGWIHHHLPISKLLKWLSSKTIMINLSDHVTLILNDNADGL